MSLGKFGTSIALLVALLALVLTLTNKTSVDTDSLVQTVLSKVSEATGFGAVASPDIFGPVTIRDGLTERPKSFATSTSGTATLLTERDLLAAQYQVFTKLGAAAQDHTYTYPASSTITSLLPSLGSKTEICYYNVASSTSSHDLVFAAGTGVDFQTASTTPAQTIVSKIAIEEGDAACVKLERLPRSDGSLSQLGDISAVWEFRADID